MSDNLESVLGLKSLLLAAQAGSSSAFAQLLTALERLGPKSLALKALLNPSRPAFRVGITGPPGSGKSTLIAELLKSMSSKNLKIGVLAVDPSSPISHGAILGDRIRYNDHTLDPKIFIRSLGTRGSLGGLSASAYLMLRAFDICDFDVVLIETVGVGQVEVEIMNVADFVTVVLVPESGDSIQAMKAGISEIANLFVVNKSDRPGAESLKREIEASVALSDKKVDVLLSSALHGEGISEIISTIFLAQKNLDIVANRKSVLRLREEAKSLLRSALEEEASQRVGKILVADDLAKLFE